MDGLATDKGYLGTGDLMVKDLSNSQAGFRPIGNVSVFSITPAAETTTRKSFKKAKRGQTLDTVVTLVDTNIELQTNTVMSKENLALLLQGDYAAFTQTLGSGVEQVLADVELDIWLDITGYNISSVSAVFGSTTLVAGTEDDLEGADYIVKPEAGMIMFLSTGDVTAGGSVTVTYDRPAIAESDKIYTVTGGKIASKKLQLRLDGYNEVTEKTVLVDVWQLRISPSDAFNFIGEDFASSTLSGIAETPEDQSGPYQVIELPAMS